MEARDTTTQESKSGRFKLTVHFGDQSLDPTLSKYPYQSYTGVVKYYRNIGNGNGFIGIGEDKIITCKLKFDEIELNEKYSISFFGGFRPVLFKLISSDVSKKSTVL